MTLAPIMQRMVRSKEKREDNMNTLTLGKSDHLQWIASGGHSAAVGARGKDVVSSVSYAASSILFVM